MLDIRPSNRFRKDLKLIARRGLDLDLHSICWDTSKGHMDFSSDTVYIYGKTIPASQDNLKQ